MSRVTKFLAKEQNFNIQGTRVLEIIMENASFTNKSGGPVILKLGQRSVYLEHGKNIFNGKFEFGKWKMSTGLILDDISAARVVKRLFTIARSKR